MIWSDSNISITAIGYWRNLCFSLDFADQSLRNCVRVIHDDIVEIWNLNDKTMVWFFPLPLVVLADDCD
jgi:hypothetical protein